MTLVFARSPQGALHLARSTAFGAAVTACGVELPACELVLAPDAEAARKLAGGVELCPCAKTA